jgi:hypothetical protein
MQHSNIKKMLYYMDWPYTILWVTDRFINCNLARRVMNYLLYYTQYLQICQTVFFVCYCISKAKHQHSNIKKMLKYKKNNYKSTKRL